MIKVVGKSPPDPVQEKLRQTKKVWNKQVSEFADNLFRLKDMMNGKPSKFYPEKSSIKDPIPGDPVTIIGTLVNDFQEIAQKGNDIVRLQVDYSKTRRKKQPQKLLAPIGTPTPANTNNLSQQLTAAENYKLIVTGSNPFSRFFARMLNPAIGNSPQARARKYRMSLLKSAIEIHEDLIELEVTIVKSTPESVFATSKILSKIEDNWEFFKTGINTYKESSPQNKPTDVGGKISVPDNGKTIIPLSKTIVTPKQINKPVSSIENSDKVNMENILSDYKKYALNITDVNLKNLTNLIGQYKSAKEQDKEILISQIKIEYNNVLSNLNSKYNTMATSFREIWETKKVKAQYNTDKLEAIGDKTIQRWLGKIKHQLSPSDKTSAHRLDIYKLANQSRKIVDKIMDSLEKEMDIKYLETLSNEISDNFKIIEHLISSLENTLYGKNFDKSFINLLESGKITNFDTNLTSSQRDHLQRMIEKRRIRELTDFYQGKKMSTL